MTAALVRPFTSTCVFYEEGDALGSLAALASLAPIFAVVSLATALASRRDVHTLSLLVGKLLDDGLNAALKHAIREPRPEGNDKWSSEYGMPSNHSQFVAFLAAYALLWVGSGRLHALRTRPVWAGLVCAGAVVGALLVMVSRVHLRYHTWQQVAAGAAVGTASGAAWFLLTERVLRSRVYPALVSSGVGRWLLLRDLGEVDTIAVEYEAAVAAAAAAAAAASKGGKGGVMEPSGGEVEVRVGRTTRRRR
jgi:dolichyldiphosphatase